MKLMLAQISALLLISISSAENIVSPDGNIILVTTESDSGDFDILVKDKRNKEPYKLNFGTDLFGSIKCSWYLNGNAAHIQVGEGREWVGNFLSFQKTCSPA